MGYEESEYPPPGSPIEIDNMDEDYYRYASSDDPAHYDEDSNYYFNEDFEIPEEQEEAEEEDEEREEVEFELRDGEFFCPLEEGNSRRGSYGDGWGTSDEMYPVVTPPELGFVYQAADFTPHFHFPDMRQQPEKKELFVFRNQWLKQEDQRDQPKDSESGSSALAKKKREYDRLRNFAKQTKVVVSLILKIEV